MTAPDHRRLTRTGYDIVAEDYATLIPDLSAETSLDVAMIDDFAGRCLDWAPRPRCPGHAADSVRCGRPHIYAADSAAS